MNQKQAQHRRRAPPMHSIMTMVLGAVLMVEMYPVRGRLML
jgi:hypothetical protein